MKDGAFVAEELLCMLNSCAHVLGVGTDAAEKREVLDGLLTKEEVIETCMTSESLLVTNVFGLVGFNVFLTCDSLLTFTVFRLFCGCFVTAFFATDLGLF